MALTLCTGQPFLPFHVDMELHLSSLPDIYLSHYTYAGLQAASNCSLTAVQSVLKAAQPQVSEHEAQAS